MAICAQLATVTDIGKILKMKIKDISQTSARLLVRLLHDNMVEIIIEEYLSLNIIKR